MNYSPNVSFSRLLADAINEVSAKGYISRERVEEWIGLLRRAAERELGPEANIDETLKRTFGATFKRLVEEGRVAKYVPGVTRFNIQMIRPQLRAELDRRILAAADLIKLNRRNAVEDTLQRFLGWSTSIPPGGAGVIDKRGVREDIGKSMAQLSYERRRCETDQGMKLIANIAEIVANDAGAIAGIWHDHGEHDSSYNARKEHMERAKKCKTGLYYAVKDNWAIKAGLMNKGLGYLEDMSAAGSEVFCRCWVEYVLSPRRLPDAMLTQKGREWIERGRLEAQMRTAA